MLDQRNVKTALSGHALHEAHEVVVIKTIIKALLYDVQKANRLFRVLLTPHTTLDETTYLERSLKDSYEEQVCEVVSDKGV